MLDVPENQELQEKLKELEEYISNIKNVREWKRGEAVRLRLSERVVNNLLFICTLWPERKFSRSDMVTSEKFYKTVLLSVSKLLNSETVIPVFL
jgi:hypothetical protein